MTSKHRSISISGRIALTLVAGVAGSLLVTGCGIGGSLSNGTTGAIVTEGFGGAINGGPNPVSGATIKLYVTGNSDGTNGGYGVAHVVQEANQQGALAGQDTDADGSFQFAGGYSCPSGQYLYIVGSGGDTGAGVNPKAVLVAALGRCDDLFTAGKYTGSFVYLNELSTVAAGYALGAFSSVSGSGASVAVNIGAPDANNAAVGCVANGTSCATTAAAGLRHAFANAQTLVNTFAPPINGNSNLPNNPLARVPLQLINTIANSLITCINSDGTSTACKTIFAATSTDFTTGNTFQVVANLAKNPTLTGTGKLSGDFYGVATPQTTYYRPYLTAAPIDYSIAVIYARGMGATTGTQGLSYPLSGALDINDNFYVGNYDSAAKTKFNVVSLTSNGTVATFTPDSTVNPTATAAVTDALGNLYLLGSSTVTPNTAISRYTVDPATATVSPAPVTFFENNNTPISAAVDQHNNLWYGTKNIPTIIEIAQGTTFPAQGIFVNQPVTAIAIDPDQNVWAANSSSTTGNLIDVIQNTGTVGSPAYSSSDFTLAAIPNALTSGVSFVDNGGGNFTAYVATTGPSSGLTPVTPTIVGAEVTGVTAGSIATGGSGVLNNQTDGAGTIWAADNGDFVKYNPVTPIKVRINPCHFSTTSLNTNCTQSGYVGITGVAIDSTGSLWSTVPGSAGIVQIIGGAAPTWPLLSLGKLGIPQ